MTVPETAALPAELTVPALAGLRTQWLPRLDALERGAALDVDASAVHEIDAAGVQWLLALQRSARERGLRLALHAPSAVLVDAAGALAAHPVLAAFDAATAP